MNDPPTRDGAVAARVRAAVARAAPALGVVAAALGLALAARHGLVEPAGLTARCDAVPWNSPACAARSLVVQAFLHQRLTVAAAVLALAGAMLRHRALALGGLGLGVAALVLYGASLAAPVALGALLAWQRAAAPGRNAEGGA